MVAEGLIAAEKAENGFVTLSPMPKKTPLRFY